MKLVNLTKTTIVIENPGKIIINSGSMTIDFRMTKNLISSVRTMIGTYGNLFKVIINTDERTFLAREINKIPDDAILDESLLKPYEGELGPTNVIVDHDGNKYIIIGDDVSSLAEVVVDNTTDIASIGSRTETIENKLDGGFYIE